MSEGTSHTSTTIANNVIVATDIRHRYSGVLALDGLSIAIASGSFAAVLGPNGAGKSTLAQILTGMLKQSSGTVSYAGVPDGKARPGEGMIRSGICLIAEGRRLFGQLTIEENLILGGYGAGLKRKEIRDRMEEVVPTLPAALREGMRTRQAGMLSGGERQMLALARALMADPRVMIIDEPSMGLAPILIDKVYEVLKALNKRGVTILVVEQQATHAIVAADTVHVLERGKLIYSGAAKGDAATQALRAGYVGAGGKKRSVESSAVRA
ncbi:ABC transporter ATP-binding protein [soil metagenome]